MHKALSVTLVADGTSDLYALTPIVMLLLDEWSPVPYSVSQAGSLGQGHALGPRLRAACELFPCDLLLVHRDAERSTITAREGEVQAAIREAQVAVPHVCVIPVQMTEAWLLTDEAAIRSAVGNPKGAAVLKLPRWQDLESRDAKAVLFQAIELASELGARRIRGLRSQQYRHRVAEALRCLEPLRKLPSFVHFEAALTGALGRYAVNANV
jgi:hypothetical protein